MQWKKKYPNTVKRSAAKKKSSGGNAKKTITPIDSAIIPMDSAKLRETIIERAVRDDAFASYCVDFGNKPIRVWVVSDMHVDLPHDTNLRIKLSKEPDDSDATDVLVFYRCTFSTVNQLTITQTNTVFVECRSNFLETITTDSHLGIVRCCFYTLTKVFNFDTPDTTCVIQNHVCGQSPDLDGDWLDITGFLQVIIKDMPELNHKFGIYGCKNALIENVQSGKTALNEYETTIFFARHIGTYYANVTFKDCSIERPVNINIDYQLNLSLVNTKLSMLEANYATFHTFELDSKSSVEIMRAIECSFHEFVDAEKVNLFPVRCNGYGDCRELTLYKQVCYYPFYMRPFIRWVRPKKYIVAKLFVPSWAARHFCGGKIRVSEAKVQAFFSPNGIAGVPTPFHPGPFSTIRSIFDNKFKYSLNAIVKPTNEYADNDNVCASGIHGFFDIQSAIDY